MSACKLFFEKLQIISNCLYYHARHTHRDTLKGHLQGHTQGTPTGTLTGHSQGHTHKDTYRDTYKDTQIQRNLCGFLRSPTKNPSPSILLFKRLPRQNAFLFKKSLAMGCSVDIVETIERHDADENNHTKHQ